MWTGAELAVTGGVVLLLLVVHQLWWTNREAQAGADEQVRALESEWGRGDDRVVGPQDPGGTKDAPEGGGSSNEKAGRAKGGGERPATAAEPKPAPRWDQAYAVLSIPRLGVRIPVAEGISKSGVLNKGYAGHYPETAQPGRPGNFALAGHRNTHGEPFRHIDRLRPGDRLTVETEGAEYGYVVDRTLPETLPGDGGVIAKVPRSAVRPSAGYDAPGYFITLTTCTPEYTSKYRLVVWGKLKSVEPR
ncbi:class E sortase [Streptomyces sp. YIM 130001]|uniref:class E sortase n=1 Tax=Streptomyces sp. YIM 130001 TaxID=2259644 RepID=UPI001F08B10F|nr:class E sortase [Streptomyces sp. YIM 130001]